MHKIILTILLFVFWAGPALAQNILWSRTYGGSGYDGCNDDCLCVQQTTDGGYIVVGGTDSFGAGGRDVYLIKTDSLGDTLWSRTYGGSDTDYGFSVQQTADGGYIVAGRTESFGAGDLDVYLIKTDSLGDTMWTHVYGGGSIDWARSVQQTTDGGYIVAGWTGFGAGGFDVFVIKTNFGGDVVWSRTYGGSNYEVAHSVQQTTDGGYIVAGYTSSFGVGLDSPDIERRIWEPEDVYLIKTNSTGDTVWSRTYGGSREDRGYSVQQTTDGGYIVTGSTYSFGAGDLDVYLIKTNSLGDTLWSRTYGAGAYEAGYSVRQTTDGGYIVAGFTSSFGAYQSDVYLIKTNTTGDTLWSRIFGTDGSDYAFSVRQTPDKGYIVAAGTHIEGSNYDIILTKLDSLGNTCIGEFVSSTAMSVVCSVTSPVTVVTSPSFIATSPPETVTSPATEVTTVCWWVCGDVNGDGVVDLGDVLYLISYLYKGGPAPDPLETGDVNCDGVVDLGDVLYLISYLYKGGPPPCC